ncbi:hypothetical protein IEU95_05175 [Hoyosella rhizosphaerae]|uniref:hypothetical protein n=1 Tax=Hoyosella rhizosphaerae TaxID=1755582 RepID=UPI0016683C62|nr:hypothetical protein [Hoyosella rhizosphaerae]MBN4926210.1 hypothetical protein [Hoyosella rhizosphaerae]
MAKKQSGNSGNGNGQGGPDELLNALTDYIADQLSGDALIEWVHVEVGHALGAAEKLTLGDVVTPAQVSGAAIKYALEWRIEGAIPELAGDIASRIHRRTFEDADETLRDVDFTQVVSFAEKFLAMPAFQRVVDRVYDSPLARDAAAWFVYRTAIDSLQRNRALAGEIPGVGSLLRLSGALSSRVIPGVSAKLDAVFRDLTERAVAVVLAGVDAPDMSESGDPLVSVLMDAFASRQTESLGALGDTIGPDDVEAILVLGFEFWRDFRGTRAMRTAIEEGVGVFFSKYSDYSLADLLNELGVTRDDMIEEALRFAPRALEVLQSNGLFDSFVRRQFRGFVDSDRVKRMLR